MVHVHKVTQGTDEWKKLREGKYTGSNAHKLLRYGANPFSLTASTDFKGNFWTKRGHILEDEAINLYERITGKTVDRPGFITNTGFPDCGYSPDGRCGYVLLEVKCFDQKKHMAIVNGGIPLEVQAQVHFGMMICEMPVANLIVYNPELPTALAFKIIGIASNRKIENNFKQILSKGVAHA